eukprot:TRINITY_DN7135_c0_g2_i1.p1 TRINITY_DN7135_c0_g2~~TRINITY_DN7135_c0_g2_i1.p1  ORF type:complete len:424 (+),score=185.18 TRINITY_DN7135_c0_g2_i1:66-1274(+)
MAVRALCQRLPLLGARNCFISRFSPSTFITKRFFSADEFTIVVPSMGDSISTGTIASWTKAVGDPVNVDDVVVVLETDKVSVDVRSPKSGSLLAQLGKVQDTLAVGEPLAKIKVGPAPEAPKAAAPAAKAAAPAAAAPAAPAPAKAAAPAPAKAAAPAPAPAANKSVKVRTETRVPLSPARQHLLARMKNTQSTYAMLTTFNEIDMTNLIKFREQYGETFNKKFGVKLNFLSCFVKAAVVALRAQPALNNVIEGTNFVERYYYDISVGVATPQGTVNPILRNAESLSFAQIEEAIAKLGVKARENNLAIEDLTGPTFAINNSVVEHGFMGQGTLTPPCSAALNLHGIQKRPVAVDDKTAALRPMMYASLTYDHRIVDGREAVFFLRKVKECVEDPSRMLFEL